MISHKTKPNQSLHQKTIAITHQAHQRIIKTKQCIGLVSSNQQNYRGCKIVPSFMTRLYIFEPLQLTQIPSKPWSFQLIDFTNSFLPGDNLFVVINDYSYFPEVKVVSSTSAMTIIPKLKTIFFHQGTPFTIKTDNSCC